MSYIEFDPTNPASFENYVPTNQRKVKNFFKAIIVTGIVCLVIYLVLKKSDNDYEEDIIIS